MLRDHFFSFQHDKNTMLTKSLERSQHDIATVAAAFVHCIVQVKSYLSIVLYPRTSEFNLDNCGFYLCRTFTLLGLLTDFRH